MTDPTFEALAKGLRAWARNQTAPEQAAVELLIWHETWLRRPDFTGAAVTEQVSGPVAVIHWRDAREFIDRGYAQAGRKPLPVSSSAQAVLDVAVALGEDRFRLTGFGRVHRRAVAEAFAAALGQRLVPAALAHNHPDFIPGDATCPVCAQESTERSGTGLPPAAVQAAAEALAAGHQCDPAAHERDARATLEAAAPHLVAAERGIVHAHHPAACGSDMNDGTHWTGDTDRVTCTDCKIALTVAAERERLGAEHAEYLARLTQEVDATVRAEAAAERARIASIIPAATLDGLADWMIRGGSVWAGPAAVPDLGERLKQLARLLRQDAANIDRHGAPETKETEDG
jgi:hypothetical protein